MRIITAGGAPGLALRAHEGNIDRGPAPGPMRHLERFAAEPRPIGGAAGERAKNYLVEQLRAAGLPVQTQRAAGANASRGPASFGQVRNVVATRPGTDPTGTPRGRRTRGRHPHVHPLRRRLRSVRYRRSMQTPRPTAESRSGPG
ncbi:hypothetical protein Acsp04_14340 [Actinomadura sp. NBRC 104425]|nr:hypothetical protein Acsp04_14340 [Actinomadura sp. NBRC 104425]